MKSFKVVLLAVCGLLMLSGGAFAQTEKVVVYNDYNFSGANMVLDGNWSGGKGFDRIIKSIRVPSGYRVTFYDKKDFKGTESRVTEDWNPGQGAYWINRIRSIRVDRVAIDPPVRPLPPTTPSPAGYPVIYAGTNFDGAAEAIENGKTELQDWDGSPHTIRSIRVPDGWFLTLYTRSNYRGKSYDVNSNITFAPGDQFYNRIRSIKVSKTPPKQPR